MALFDTLARGFGGGLFPGVDPEVQRQLLQMSLLQTGLGLMAGAGQHGPQIIPQAIGAGLENYQQGLGQFEERQFRRRAEQRAEGQFQLAQRSDARAAESAQREQERHALFMEGVEFDRLKRAFDEEGLRIFQASLEEQQSLLAAAAERWGDDHPIVMQGRAALANRDTAAAGKLLAEASILGRLEEIGPEAAQAVQRGDIQAMERLSRESQGAFDFSQLFNMHTALRNLAIYEERLAQSQVPDPERLQTELRLRSNRLFQARQKLLMNQLDMSKRIEAGLSPHIAPEERAEIMAQLEPTALAQWANENAAKELRAEHPGVDFGGAAVQPGGELLDQVVLEALQAGMTKRQTFAMLLQSGQYTQDQIRAAVNRFYPPSGG